MSKDDPTLAPHNRYAVTRPSSLRLYLLVRSQPNVPDQMRPSGMSSWASCYGLARIGIIALHFPARLSDVRVQRKDQLDGYVIFSIYVVEAGRESENATHNPYRFSV